MPKFSIRQLLLFVLIFALIFAVLGWATRGNDTAFGLAMALFGLTIPFFMFAVLTWVGILSAKVSGATPVNKPVVSTPTTPRSSEPENE